MSLLLNNLTSITLKWISIWLDLKVSIYFTNKKESERKEISLRRIIFAWTQPALNENAISSLFSLFVFPLFPSGWPARENVGKKNSFKESFWFNFYPNIFTQTISWACEVTHSCYVVKQLICISDLGMASPMPSSWALKVAGGFYL